jgi:hypothetical protein
VRTEPRFPGVPQRAGHYESFYIKATRRTGGQGIWIRHTVHKRPGEDATAALWLTLFDRDALAPRAVKQSFGTGALTAPAGVFIRIGDAVLEPGRATGGISGPELEASWDLTFDDAAEPFHHLPYERLYTARLPRTKLLSPYPSACFSGALRVGETELALDEWPGMVGHNWGAEHAERWVWIQAPALDGSDASCFDFAAGRIRIGPVTTPWLGNGVLRLGGDEHRLGGLGLSITKVAELPTRCDFELGGKGARVRGRVSSEPRHVVAWIYADPNGSEHQVLNCSIADLELEIERDGRKERVEVRGTAAYELGMRETDHGIQPQSAPDGL